MFLDEQIVNMVIEQKERILTNAKGLMTDIVLLFHQRLSDELKKKNSNPLSATKLVCSIWDSAAKTLDKKGYSFLKIGGLKEFLMMNEEISKIIYEQERRMGIRRR